MTDERTIYDDERTQYQSRDDEATQYDEAHVKNPNAREEKNEAPKAKKKDKPMWKRAAAGLGTGVLLGGAATVFSRSAPVGHEDSDTHEDGNEEAPAHPAWSDGEVPVATSVSDDMSFSEAFSAAREEVGPGGAFEWHGNVYGSYTEDEWNNMTAEERAEYGSHFSWNSNSREDMASNHHQATNDEVEVVAENDDEDVELVGESIDDDVEIEGVTPGSEEDAVVFETGEPEVEILGVVHDDETGANIGGLVVDGQEVVLIDVGGDEVFNVMGTDLNGDHQITQDEWVDITDQNLTVSDLGGFSVVDDPMCVSSNEMEYYGGTGVYEG